MSSDTTTTIALKEFPCECLKSDIRWNKARGKRVVRCDQVKPIQLEVSSSHLLSVILSIQFLLEWLLNGRGMFMLEINVLTSLKTIDE